MKVEEVLALLDSFRSAGRIEYDAYSALHDAVSEIEQVEYKKIYKHCQPKPNIVGTLSIFPLLKPSFLKMEKTLW